MKTSDDKNRDYHKGLISKFRNLLDLRPMNLSIFLLRFLADDERRRIVSTGMGLRLYVDPFTHLGRSIVTEDTYEKETVGIFNSELESGQVVLDIGANEGVFSALSGKIVGKDGLVIAIEPQSRLRDIIEINLRINDLYNFKIYQSAIGGDETQTMKINLYPVLNSGASSLLRQHRVSKKTEEISFVSIDTILKDSKLTKIDFIKIDVEGFEHLVIKQLLPYMKRGQVGKLLLDYHSSILQAFNINPLDIHNSIIASNMRVKIGDPKELSSYILYEKNS
jgi:FkbM family methyltransferase